MYLYSSSKILEISGRNERSMNHPGARWLSCPPGQGLTFLLQISKFQKKQWPSANRAKAKRPLKSASLSHQPIGEIEPLNIAKQALINHLRRKR